MTDETATSALAVEPPAAVVAEPVVEPEPPAAVEPPVAADPPVEPAPVVEHGNKGKKPWFLTEISDERAAKNAEREGRLTAERKLQEAQALLQRMQTNPDTPPTPQPQQTIPDAQEIDRLVDQRAETKRFVEDTVSVKNAGLAAFGANFETTLGILTDLGVTKDDVVADFLAVDKANTHILLDRLAADPEKASALARMTPLARIAEITRMSMTAAPAAKPTPAAPAVPPARQVSRAPAPPPPVEPSASQEIDWRSDKASDADFSRGWEENQKKRARR